MTCVDDFRLMLGKREFVPIMIGGMGVDISTAGLALEAARLGGIGQTEARSVGGVAGNSCANRCAAQQVRVSYESSP